VKRFLFYLALFGWVISFTVHLLSIFNIYLGDNFPIDVYLTMGIFFIWVPAIIISQGKKDSSQQNDESDDKGNIFYTMAIIPRWIQIIAILSFIYATVNFWLCVNGYTAEIYNGQYVLMEKSTFIKYLTQTEYIHYKANDARLATGHCLGFYALGLAMLSDKK
jgi:magnesium-transporting ATPase (P-type)